MSLKPYYQDSAVTIYHGDCREIVPTLGRFDAVITDPPYGVGLTHKQHKWFVQDGEGYASTDDTPENVKNGVVPVIEICLGIADRVMVTPGIRCMFLYPTPKDVGCIFNSAGAGMGSWGFTCAHPVLYYGTCPYLAKGMGSRPNGWLQPADDYSDKNGHPCPKPMGMMTWLVNRGSLEGQTVLDPFAGSGTTGRACKDLGRKCTMIEREERYCEIAARRMGQEVLNLT